MIIVNGAKLDRFTIPFLPLTSIGLHIFSGDFWKSLPPKIWNQLKGYRLSTVFEGP